MSSAGSVTHWISRLQAGDAAAAEPLGGVPRTVRRRLGVIRGLWEQESNA
jgi:hypothetical protein